MSGDRLGYEPQAAAGVSTSRSVSAGGALSGGGDLSADRTISLAALDPSPAQTYTNPTEITVDQYGRVLSVTEGAGGGGSNALTSLGSNPSVTELAPGKYRVTGGSSGVLILAVGAVDDYWRIVIEDTGVTAGIVYPGDGCHLRYGGSNQTEIGYDTGTGYIAFEFWKTSATRYTVLAIKAAGGTT